MHLWFPLKTHYKNIDDLGTAQIVCDPHFESPTEQ